MKNLKETKANRIHNLIIVDESGSMNCIRKQAFTHSFAIDEHMMFMQTEEGTDAMFECERRSRGNFNCCIASGCAIPTGKFFEPDEEIES